MKNLFYLILFSIALTVFACTNNQVTEQSIKPLEDTFYKRLEGKIGKNAVVINLFRTGKDIHGSITYNMGFVPLTLDTFTADSIFLNINNIPDSYWNKDDAERISLKWTGTGFSGWWTNSKKEYKKLELEELYPIGSEKLTYVHFTDSIRAFQNKKDSPIALFKIDYLKSNNNWLNNELQSAIGIEKGNTIWDTGVRQLFAKYLNEYKKEVKEFEKEGTGAPNYFLNYYKNTLTDIKFNEAGFIVSDIFYADYTGGAHGNYASNLINYDSKNQQKVHLKDIITIDSNKLNQILESNFRKQYNLNPTDRLDKILFDNTIKTSENFYFNRNGIGFLYNPYEIASYAQGQLLVFIPFSDLKEYLNINFKNRLGVKF